MCGRYFIASEEDELAIKEILEEINKKYKNTPELSAMKTGEIYPTEIVPVLTAGTPMLMKWSFPRYDGKGQIINARLETAAEKTTFRYSFMGKRCLIPASWYFEWKKSSGLTKQKYAIGLGETIFMAGLYQVDINENLPRFVILTQPAAPNLEFIHHRMPVILTKDYHKPWLDNHLDTQDLMNNPVDNLHYEPINYQPSLF